MSVAHSYIQTPLSTLPVSITDIDHHQNPSLATIPRTMNSSHLTGPLPGQPQMLNLYPGPTHQQQQPFHTIPPQQQPPPPSAAHPPLGMMTTSNPAFVPSSGMPSALQHTLQQQHQQHHPQNPQQRIPMLQQQQHQQQQHQQRPPMPTGPGLMPNPNSQFQQGIFPPTMNPGMRRISAQTQPIPQGSNPMAMGLQVPPQMPPLRPGQPNPRMSGAQPPTHHEMAHLMGMARTQPPSQHPPPLQQQQQQQQQQHQSPMVNGIQSNLISRPTPGGGQLNPPSHPLSHQQQPQHRPPPFQPPAMISPHHAPSPTRPPSHHGPSPGNNVPGGPAQPMQQQQQPPQQNMFPSSNAPHPSQQGQPLQRPSGASGPFSFHPDNHIGQPPSHNSPRSAMGGPSNNMPPTQPRLPPQQPFNIAHTPRGGSQEPFSHVLPSPHTATPHQSHRIPPSVSAAAAAAAISAVGQQQPIPGPSRPDAQPQAGPSRSPRPPSRHPNQAPQRAPPPPPPPLTQTPGHVQPILSASTSPISSRTSTVGGGPLPPPSQTPSSAAASVGEMQASSLPGVAASGPPPRPALSYPTNVVGNGQGVLRVMEFSSCLADENCNRLKLEHWEKMTKMFFAPLAMWKLTLWKDNERREAKPFEIGANVLAMLLLVSSQSGVRSMSLVLDGVQERALNPGTSIVDCPSAQWIWRFYEGHVISLRGTFSCQVSAYYNPEGPPDRPYTLKFDTLTFDSNSHEKLIALESIRGTRGLESVQRTPATTTQGSPDNASSSGSSNNTVKTEEGQDRQQVDADPRVVIEHAVLPPEPVNAFGIPQASMRCLELAESVGQMTELFHFCYSQKIGPQEGLVQMGKFIRSLLPPQAVPYIIHTNPGIPEHTLSSSSLKEGSSSSDREAARLVSSSQPAPPATPTQSGPAQASPRPQPLSGTSSKTTPNSGGVAAPSGPLKRKAQQAPEPSGNDAQPPAKRMTTRRKSKAG